MEGEPREQFLVSQTGDDPELIDEVRSLIEALARPSVVDELVDDTSDDAGGTSSVPDSGAPGLGEVGPYKLRRLLGQGGMGSVFLADRVGEDYVQQVALKLVRAGYFDPKLEERFREERRILARLRHPGIAQLLDGGVTPGGHPYFALELVEGTPLLDYCAAKELPLEARLGVFLEICAPVHYAHSQLVIHRDLKPANILVTAAGHVKLLDFGVAKLVETRLADGDATRTSPWITPAYAAPEQIRGETAGTAADIYALGVILYELLTGARPYTVDPSLPPSEVERIVCHLEPTRPSRAVTETGSNAGGPSIGGDSTAARLSRQLTGDLDTIVLKALAKLPERRYGSVSALADDVRRYLEGHPVLARPDTAAYRARKFVQRHRVAVLAGAAVFGVLLIGGAAVAVAGVRAAAQRDVAQAEAERADEVAGLMLEIFQLSDPARSLGDTISAREILDRGTTRIQDRLEGQPLTQAELLSQVAEVYRGLGMSGRAEELARSAHFIRETELGANDATTAESLGQIGVLLRDQGRIGEAIPLLERAVEARKVAAIPTDTVLASMQASLAAGVRAMGEFDRARMLWEESLETRVDAFGEAHPLVAESRVGLAAALHEAGEFGPAQDVLRDLVNAGRGSAEPSVQVATAAIELGALLNIQERFTEAHGYLEEALRIRSVLYGTTHPDHIEARLHFTNTVYGLGRFSEAAEMAEEALSDAAVAWGAKHPTATSLRVHLARASLALGEAERAAAIYDTVLAHKHEYYGGDHNDLVFNYLFSAEPALANGRLDLARGAVMAASSMRSRLSGATVQAPGVSEMLEASVLGRVAAAEGSHEEAGRHFELAVAVAEASLRPNHRYRIRILRERSAWWIDQGRAAEALPVLLDLIAVQEPALDPDAIHPQLGHTRLEAGRALLELGRTDEARAHLQGALEHYDGLPHSQPAVRRATRLLQTLE